MQNPEYIPVGDDGGQRNHAAAERFAQQVDVGHDAEVVARECASGPCQTRLDLVGDHQHVVLGAQRADARQEVVEAER